MKNQIKSILGCGATHTNRILQCNEHRLSELQCVLDIIHFYCPQKIGASMFKYYNRLRLIDLLIPDDKFNYSDISKISKLINKDILKPQYSYLSEMVMSNEEYLDVMGC